MMPARRPQLQLPLEPKPERRLPFVSGARRPRYQLTLEGSADNRMDIHKLRMILKRLLRDDKLRCLEAREL